MPRPPLTHSWVVLTMGDRLVELEDALASIVAAGGDDVLVVRNGTTPDAEGPDACTALIDRMAGHGVRSIELADNVGVAEGRNRGVEATTGDVIFFLDDDAALAEPTVVSDAIDRFAVAERLGILGFRIVDPVSGYTSRRHVPRLRASDPLRSGPVTSFSGGACAIRRECFGDVDGFDGTFFFGMEETDLSLRAIDAGWTIEYQSDLVVTHPATDPTRHEFARRLTARNRTLLARKSLPHPLSWLYVVDWLVLNIMRNRSLAATRADLAATRDGMAATVARQPIRWRTVWKLSRLGRPPII